MAEAHHMVTVSGLPGSGTSTVCALLSQRLSWPCVNVGQSFREMAEEAGLSLAEFGRAAESDGEIDKRLDARTVEMARNERRLILEGRVCAWMTHRHGLRALKVWLEAGIECRAQRVSSRDGQVLSETLSDMRERERSEAVRYRTHHQIAIDDLSVYDLIIETDQLSAADVAGRITHRLIGSEKEA